MCFVIDEKAKRPKGRVAYKVVELYSYDHTLHSLFARSYIWDEGVHELKPGARTKKQRSYMLRARANQGFYVYLNKARAVERARYCDNLVVLKLEVDPADWLYSEMVFGTWGRKRSVATYRRVTVPTNQPYLEFYE